ncbi:MAG TPA: VCBS repeat-containing protein [Archangium sp.]|nr:VCBS repeat-containing protein [Archangium sp.]
MNARLTRNLLTVATATATLFSAGSAMASAKSDFNADGKADIIWRHQPADALHIWYMSGETYIGGAALQVTGSTLWDVQTVGDFNGDGKPDLGLRNTSTGENHIWVGYGPASTTQFFSAVATTTVLDQNWKMSGAGDFNWDGYDDLVWRNYSTGAVQLWYMKGASVVSRVNLPAVTDTKWYLGGVADFDNNGYPDLVWQNLTTGQNQLWMMDGTGGTTISSIKSLPTSSVPAMRPEAVADYTGDGCIDILRRNSTTGANELWVFDCTINRVRVAPVGAVTDLNWKIGVH